MVFFSVVCFISPLTTSCFIQSAVAYSIFFLTNPLKNNFPVIGTPFSITPALGNNSH